MRTVKANARWNPSGSSTIDLVVEIDRKEKGGWTTRSWNSDGAAIWRIEGGVYHSQYLPDEPRIYLGAISSIKRAARNRGEPLTPNQTGGLVLTKIDAERLLVALMSAIQEFDRQQEASSS